MNGLVEGIRALMARTRPGKAMLDAGVQVDFAPGMDKGVCGFYMSGATFYVNPRLEDGRNPAVRLAAMGRTALHEGAHFLQGEAGLDFSRLIFSLHPEDYLLLHKFAEADACATMMEGVLELAARHRQPLPLHDLRARDPQCLAVCEAGLAAFHDHPEDMQAVREAAFSAWFETPMNAHYERLVLDHYLMAALHYERLGGRGRPVRVRMPPRIAEDFGEGGAWIGQIRAWFPSMPEDAERFFAPPFDEIRSVDVFHDLPLAHGQMATARQSLKKAKERLLLRL